MHDRIIVICLLLIIHKQFCCCCSCLKVIRKWKWFNVLPLVNKKKQLLTNSSRSSWSMYCMVMSVVSAVWSSWSVPAKPRVLVLVLMVNQLGIPIKDDASFQADELVFMSYSVTYSLTNWYAQSATLRWPFCISEYFIRTSCYHGNQLRKSPSQKLLMKTCISAVHVETTCELWLK